MSLAGKTVLVTRPHERGTELASRLEELGARVLLRPTIAFDPPADPGPALRALAELDAYERIVFTSATGVSFFRAMQGDAPVSPRAPIAAIGPGTAQALREAGLAADLTPGDASAEGLAAFLASLDLAGRRVLLVGPERGRDALPEALRRGGALVSAVAFYRTRASEEAPEIAAELRRGGIDAVVFTSPSTFLLLLEAAGAERAALAGALGGLARVAIGPTTARALEREQLPAAAVAREPTPEAIAEALVRALTVC